MKFDTLSIVLISSMVSGGLGVIALARSAQKARHELRAVQEARRMAREAQIGRDGDVI